MLMAFTILGAMTAIPVRDGHRVVRGISGVSLAAATSTFCAGSRVVVERSAAATRAGRIATGMRERFGTAEDDGEAVGFTFGKNYREA